MQAIDLVLRRLRLQRGVLDGAGAGGELATQRLQFVLAQPAGVDRVLGLRLRRCQL